MVKRTLLPALCFALLVPAVALSVEVRYAAPKPQCTYLLGGFAALADPNTGQVYQGEDILGDPQFSYPVIFDTGASGVLMSEMVRTAFGIPLTGETFEDIGIGGTETFDVSRPTRLLLAPNSVGPTGADIIGNYSPYGEYKFQVKQTDSLLTGPFDIIGTPVLRNHVMHVQPNITPYGSFYPPIDYMQTTLLTSLPTLPSQGVFRFPLVYEDFIDDPNPPVSVGQNPMLPNVRIVDSRKPSDQQSSARSWLFDTGASVTIIGEDYALDVGIDLVNEDPVAEVQVAGVGGDTRLMFGYEVDELILPMANGDEFIVENAVVFVPESGVLPADLPGIIGMNLIAPAFSQVDPFIGPLDTTPTVFSDWYVDSLSNQFVLIDPNSTYVPLPSTLAIMLIGLPMLRRRR